jgi:hypothetical protein
MPGEGRARGPPEVLPQGVQACSIVLAIRSSDDLAPQLMSQNHETHKHCVCDKPNKLPLLIPRVYLAFFQSPQYIPTASLFASNVSYWSASNTFQAAYLFPVQTSTQSGPYTFTSE